MTMYYSYAAYTPHHMMISVNSQPKTTISTTNCAR